MTWGYAKNEKFGSGKGSRKEKVKSTSKCLQEDLEKFQIILVRWVNRPHRRKIYQPLKQPADSNDKTKSKSLSPGEV